MLEFTVIGGMLIAWFCFTYLLEWWYRRALARERKEWYS